MNLIGAFPILHEFLSRFLERFWPEVTGWPDRLRECAVGEGSISYSEADGCDHGVYTSVFLGLRSRPAVSESMRPGKIVNTNQGLFIFTVGGKGQIEEIEMYFSTPLAPPFFEELMSSRPDDTAGRSQEACINGRPSGLWTIDEFLRSVERRTLCVVDMEE